MSLAARLQAMVSALPSDTCAVTLTRLDLARLLGDAVAASEPKARVRAPVDRLLTAEEAGKRLGVGRRWIYRHASTLPFTRRLTGGTLRFSERGLERWIETRKTAPQTP